MEMTIRSILCGVDFSEPSRDALRWAVALAARCNSGLTAVTAVSPLLAETARMRFDLDLLSSEVSPALLQFTESVQVGGEAARPAVDTRVQVGEPAETVLDAAAQVGADLIVLGTQGLSGIRKWLLGSTVEAVLRKTSVPVLAVPPPAPGGAALSPLTLKTIVAATDFSDAAARAVRYANALATPLHARLVLAHIVAPLTVPPEYLRYIEGVEEDSLKQAQMALNSERRAMQIDQADVVAELGSPAEGITSIARDRGAGLIVLGLASKRRHAVRPGVIAYRVLCQSHVPVLVVPLEPAPLS